MGKWFDRAQICKNGHLITKHYNSEAHTQSTYCKKCGAESINKCLHCEKEIEGCLHKEAETVSFTDELFEYAYSPEVDQPDAQDSYFKKDPPICLTENYVIPAYCSKCGNPYPWTEAVIKEFEEIIDMDDELHHDEIMILKQKFPNLLAESPGTSAAALKVSKILKNASSATVQALKSAVASKIVNTGLKLLGW